MCKEKNTIICFLLHLIVSLRKTKNILTALLATAITAWLKIDCGHHSKTPTSKSGTLNKVSENLIHS